MGTDLFAVVTVNLHGITWHMGAADKAVAAMRAACLASEEFRAAQASGEETFTMPFELEERLNVIKCDGFCEAIRAWDGYERNGQPVECTPLEARDVPTGIKTAVFDAAIMRRSELAGKERTPGE